MRRLHWIVAGVLLAAPAMAWGTVMLGLSDGTDNPNEVFLNANLAGESFTVDVNLDITAAEQVAGVTFFLESLDSNAAFRITGRTLLDATLNSPVTDDGTLFNSSNNLLAPGNGKDIGVGSASGTDTISASTKLMTLTLTYQGGLPDGDYRIQIGASPSGSAPIWSDAGFNETPFDANTLGPVYTVWVPEPGTLGLLLSGLLLAIRRR